MQQEEKKKLLEYIKAAIEVETDIETQKQITTECQSWIAQKEPALVECTIPKFELKSEKGMGLAIFLIITGIILWVLLFGAVIYNTLRDFPTTLFGLGIGAWAVCGGISKAHNVKENIKFNERQRKKEMEALKSIERINIENKIKYDQSHNEWQQMRDELNTKMKMPYQQSLNVRSQLYKQDVIYPKYQNLPALTSIYEYFITGRCEELTGPHGAYNMYEDEMRKDTVISQLSTVIAHLEQIKQNQYMLYQQVKTIQETASLVNDGLTRIEGYTATLTKLSALNVYYNAVSARNARITTAWHLLS